MGIRGHNTYFHGFFVAGFSCVETTFLGAAVMTLDCVADVVAEHCYALHFLYISLLFIGSGKK